MKVHINVYTWTNFLNAQLTIQPDPHNVKQTAHLPNYTADAKFFGFCYFLHIASNLCFRLFFKYTINETLFLSHADLM
jgi:hypothetical protein